MVDESSQIPTWRIPLFKHAKNDSKGIKFRCFSRNLLKTDFLHIHGRIDFLRILVKYLILPLFTIYSLVKIATFVFNSLFFSIIQWYLFLKWISFYENKWVNFIKSFFNRKWLVFIWENGERGKREKEKKRGLL